jgi:hypothetical protein
VVLTIVYKTFEVHVHSMERAREVQRETQLARMTLNLMSRDLQSAYWNERAGIKNEEDYDREPEAFFVLTSGEEFGRPWDRLAFVSTGPSWSDNAVHRRLTREVEYRLVKDEETEEILLVRREDPTPDRDLLSGGEQWVLARGVWGLEISCTSAEGDEREAWDSREEGALPRSVLLRVWVSPPHKSEDEAVPYAVHVALPSFTSAAEPERER